MLNNFCFHVYAQKSLSHFHTLTLSHSRTLTLSHSSISHSITLDMLNKFCFHVYAQKSLFIAENCNAFFWTSASPSAPSPVTLEFIELVPSLKALQFSAINSEFSACWEWLNERLKECSESSESSESERVWEWLLSIDMKTKVVQHVEREWMSVWKF